MHTFRFRHDLQFIDSRGSLPTRRDGNLSMPTCALGIATGYTPAMGAPLTGGAFIGMKTEAVIPRVGKKMCKNMVQREECGLLQDPGSSNEE